MTDKFDVFISYQRDSEAVAQAIYARLSAEGFKVWQDVHNIRHTDRWNDAIDEALKHTDRLILLITPKSMASREVKNEWFFFYNQRKPIHSLMVEACTPHYQLLPFQYIEWDDPQESDWGRLIKELRTAFDAPTWETIISSPDAPKRTLSEAMQALREAVLGDGSIELTDEQTHEIAKSSPEDETAYHLGRIAEWSQPRYELDNRFVNLTLMLDKGEDAPQRWQAEDFRFHDLQDVLTKFDYASLVLLGAPGSGKSTLLRRLQMDHSTDQLRTDGRDLSFFIQLNGYRTRSDGTLPTPREWLTARWEERYPQLPPLEAYLRDGRVLLLLDALNEMPHKNTAEYHERVGLWRALAQDLTRMGNRMLFSCRSLDYSASLSSPNLRVPQVEVQPMNEGQVQAFLKAYVLYEVLGTPFTQLCDNTYLCLFAAASP